MSNPVEVWKSEKHPFEVWSEVERHAAERTPMKAIDAPDLERMKWYGFLYRKRDAPGRYMNRIRVTAGELSATQAREIAHITREYGHGIVDVTTRANVQVQGLEIEHLPKVVARLRNVGLSSKQTAHDNIRNVFAHPFSGLMPGELYDTRQLCHDVTRLFVDSREYSDLPRKMNICLNGTDQHSAHFWTQDVSFLATRVAGEEVSVDDVLFRVLIGGTQGQNPILAWHLPVLVGPSQVVEVTRSLLDLFRAKGSREKRNRSRFRFLVERIGVAGVLDWLAADLPFTLRPEVAPPTVASSHDELVGWFRQSDPSLWTMGLAVPVGRLTWQQLEGLGILANKWGSGELRATHEQGIAVVNVPTGFKDAAATDAAALGLSVHADAYDRNVVACTGNQFCNIAVTETKGHALQLVERLRKKALQLHGIRIHMSGCPSSCAQHFTADVGLKGVRVRRLLGTREGFDVFLGGGVAGRLHMGLPYRLGVDVDQLPELVEEVVREFYLKHRPGQTFSAYWREELQAREAVKVGDEDYVVPTWVCEGCDYHHRGEDPPVFCPSCAGLRRYFARLEEGADAAAEADTTDDVPVRDDGFVFATKLESLDEGEGTTIALGGHEYALFLENGTVHAIDSACPHEGANLADGDFANGVVTCPWHSWTFEACSGCSLDPVDNDVAAYDTLVENGNVFLKVPATTPAAPATRPAVSSKPVEGTLPVLDVIEESPDVRTFRLDNSTARLPLDFPGKFAKVRVEKDGVQTWRSFTISSSPTDSSHVDLTVKLNPEGVVSRHLFEQVSKGETLVLKGAQGGFFFDPDRHTEPLVLVSAGSGITPMMSIARFLDATGSSLPCTFLYGARTPVDVLFRDELQALAARHERFRYHVSLTQPGDGWTGGHGRLDVEAVRQNVAQPGDCRYFLCGPNAFIDSFREALLELGVPSDRVHTEQFHASKAAVTT